MSAWAKPGVKCVCVDDQPTKLTPPDGYHWTGRINISAGQTYEVSTVSIHPLAGAAVVTLKGVPQRGPRDFGYAISRFRPLVTQQDDVALFRHLLTSTPVRELVS